MLMMIAVAAMPHINPLTPRINSDLLAFLGLGLFGCATHWHLPREHQQFGFNGLSLLCGFWLLLAALQYGLQLHESYFSHFLVSISYLAAVILLTAWVGMWVQAGKGAALAQLLMGVLVIAGIITALAIVLQMLGWQGVLSPWLQKSASYPRHGGFMGQPNLSATLMNCAIVSLVFLFPAQAQKAAAPSAWRCAILGLLLWAIVGTSSRTGYIEILALAGLLMLVRKRFEVSWVWLALPLWLLLMLGLGELMASHQVVSSQLVGDSSQAVGASSAHRLRIWRDIWTMIQSAPWLGVGWHQLQVREVLMPGISEPVDHAHNVFLQIQVELGVLGSLGLLAFLAHVWLRVKPWQCQRPHEWVMLAVAMMLGMHSMLEYPLWHALFLFLLAFAMALLPGFERHFHMRPRLSGGLGVALLALTVWVYADHRHSLDAYENFSRDSSKQAFVQANQRVWWNRILFDSIFMINSPVNDDNKAMIRRIAVENANIYSQVHFPNVPLLKVMVLDGETAIANHLAWRLCRTFPEATWADVARHMASIPDPRYQQWMAQLPDMKNCKA